LFSPAIQAGESKLDMSELASRFPAHQGPTILFINFDGWKNYDEKGHTIQPFQSASGKRNRDIQEILYRTAEIFAPFNVQVVRIYGEGKYDRTDHGNSTVFVGAHTD